MECNTLNIATQLYKLIGGNVQDLESLKIVGPTHPILPSVYDVSSFAAACIGVAHLAASHFLSKRLGKNDITPVHIDRLEASAAFKSESLLQAVGWTIPPLWDPIAGDYLASDHWIRLHTNYLHHRQAVLQALKIESADRAQIEQAVSLWNAEALEQAVVNYGGCAAVMHSRHDWLASPAGNSTRNEKSVSLVSIKSAQPMFGSPSLTQAPAPLEGIKVLDLTRVIAGPECTRFLAAQGAEVLRIDPPGFQEVPGLIPETSVGKHCAFLDLNTVDGKHIFETLLKQAHVLVLGLRLGALDHYGFTLERIRSINPSLIVGLVCAYGFNSDWSGRRGFDSLVQMSTGIAEAGAHLKQVDRPTPLPAQALDHGAGFLLAAGICQALALLFEKQIASVVQTSLVGVANFLISCPKGDIFAAPPSANDFRSYLIEDHTEWGPVLRVRPAGQIGDIKGKWSMPAGPLGRHAPHFM